MDVSLPAQFSEAKKNIPAGSDVTFTLERVQIDIEIKIKIVTNNKDNKR